MAPEHDRIPPADKVFDLTETVPPYRHKRVEANTAYYAVRAAFPEVDPGKVDARYVGRVLDVAVEMMNAETIPPPPPAVCPDCLEVHCECDEYPDYIPSAPPVCDDPCPTCGQYVPEASQADVVWLMRQKRMQAMGWRVASALRREMMHEGSNNWTTSAVVWNELLECGDELAGDR